MLKLLAFGEVLFDVFGEQKHIGGAPLNFCAHAVKLGASAAVLSSVGRDELGSLALEFIESMNVSKDYVNVLEKIQTGTAVVTIKNGEPEYELVENVGYDNIALSEDQIEKIRDEKFDVFYFGTLVQRNAVSRDTLHKLLNENLFKIIFVDVNLRQNYYDKEMLRICLEKADIIKINRSEAKVLYDFCLVEALDDKEMCEALCKKYNIKLVLLTLDKDGSVLYSAEKNEFIKSSTPKSKLVSAVGAGDSFSACFVCNYLSGVSLKDCIEKATILSDYVVRFEGAIPDYSEEILKKCSI